MIKRVLVTGSRGFTGRYVSTELAAHGWEVWGVGSHEAPDTARYRCVNLVEDATVLRQVIDQIQPDAVVHLAAIAFVGHGDANAFYETNLIGTRNLLAALAVCAKKPDCVLLASSANVYGGAAEGMLNESSTLNPSNDYAVSKLAMEYMAHLWMDRLPVVIVRPFNYTGAGQSISFLLPKIVAHFRRRAEVIELGNLDVWRDFSDVRMVAQAYRRLLEVRPLGETVNICSGRAYSLREIVSLAEKITDHAMRVVVNPAFVRTNEVRTLCGDPAKLKSLIGTLQTPSLEETLSWMLHEAVK